MTWGFLARMVSLVVQYAIPMNRLATLLSTDAKRFTAGALARMLRYVARRFVPIYLALFDSLADSDILCGDDTSCRVTEVSRHLAAKPEAVATPPPWHGYRASEAAQKQLAEGATSLAAMLAAEMGFEFERRTGDGTKKALHTTAIVPRLRREPTARPTPTGAAAMRPPAWPPCPAAALLAVSGYPQVNWLQMFFGTAPSLPD